MKVLRNPTLWGVGALAIVTVLCLVAAWLYVSPPEQKAVSFYTTDASSIRPGDQVRIAGIAVGKVQSLSLEADQVRVQARIDSSAFVGDRSQVDVRMLTVVGGYYVNVTSLGNTPLGDKPIPKDRVTMPYNLMRTLTDATKITENVNPKPLNETLNQLQSGLSDGNVQSITAIVDAGNTVMSTIDRQRGQVTAILNMSDEYVRALNGFGDQLKQLVLKVSVLEQTMVLYGEALASSQQGMGQIIEALKPVGTFYMNHRDEFLEKVSHWEQTAQDWANRNGVIVRGLRHVRNKIERILDAENAGPDLLATDFCMPLPGSPC
jgi:phospholipid/cholesterol/gamma-HCH transport system substrate-binding protein